jgi:pimeloyl-ACP methyl ester carboxylesterase
MGRRIMELKKELVFNGQKEILFQTQVNHENECDIVMGVLHRPIVQTNKPVVIFCGGLNSDRSDVNRIAVKTSRKLASNNIPVVRFDYRGLALSSGNTWDMTISGKIADVKAIIMYLEREWNYKEFILLGFSDGAKNVVEVALEFSSIKGLILWNPTLLQKVKAGKKQRPVYNREIDALLWGLKGIYLGTGFYRDLVEFEKKVDDQLELLKTPTLIVWGGNDVTVEATREKINKHSNPSILQHVVPQATHLFSSEEWYNDLYNTTESWLLNLRPDGEVNR